MRLSSIGGHLHLKNVYNIVLSSKHKCKTWVGSNKRMLRYSTFNILRSSSMGGLHLKYLNTLLWSPKSQPVVGELQSICKGGWVGGRTVKSENNTNFVLLLG